MCCSVVFVITLRLLVKHFVVFSGNQHRRLLPAMCHNLRDSGRPPATVFTGCLQLLEILEISWNLNGPPGNFCVMIKNFILWLMALQHDDVALFVH